MSGEVRAGRPHLGPLLVGAMLGSLVAGRIEMALLCLAVALATAAAAGASLPSSRWIVALALSALLAWAFNLYLIPGRSFDPPWPALLGRTPTREGLALGLLLTVRMAGAITALQGLRAAWPGEQAADTAARWLAPLERLRVPVGETRAMIGLSLRFMPLLKTEAQRIARVQDLRAGRPPRGVREWMQRRRAAAVPAMVGALERAERVAQALEARHYRLRPAHAGPRQASGSGAPGRIASVAGIVLAAWALLWRS